MKAYVWSVVLYGCETWIVEERWQIIYKPSKYGVIEN